VTTSAQFARGSLEQLEVLNAWCGNGDMSHAFGRISSASGSIALEEESLR
jgi:hypothetical protein